jgi:hypothetical protein
LSLIQTTCPGFVIPNVASVRIESPIALPGCAEVDAWHIDKISGDHQVIPLNGWQNFGVVVSDDNRKTIAGAKVAWRTSDLGPYTYIGVTDAEGISTPTNLYTAASAGKHTQVATLVNRDTSVGFTDWNKLKCGGKSVDFDFSFSPKSGTNSSDDYTLYSLRPPGKQLSDELFGFS